MTVKASGSSASGGYAMLALTAGYSEYFVTNNFQSLFAQYSQVLPICGGFPLEMYSLSLESAAIFPRSAI